MKLRRGQRLTIEAVAATDEPASLATGETTEVPRRHVATNGETEDQPTPSKPVDEETYARYGGVEIRVDAEDLLVLRETDVIAPRPLTQAERGRLDDLRTGITDDLRRLKQLSH
jgi:co-chaperonin GroES (HSP10)